MLQFPLHLIANRFKGIHMVRVRREVKRVVPHIGTHIEDIHRPTLQPQRVRQQAQQLKFVSLESAVEKHGPVDEIIEASAVAQTIKVDFERHGRMTIRMSEEAQNSVASAQPMHVPKPPQQPVLD